jgi:hypothetical protein
VRKPYPCQLISGDPTSPICKKPDELLHTHTHTHTHTQTHTHTCANTHTHTHTHKHKHTHTHTHAHAHMHRSFMLMLPLKSPMPPLVAILTAWRRVIVLTVGVNLKVWPKVGMKVVTILTRETMEVIERYVGLGHRKAWSRGECGESREIL